MFKSFLLHRRQFFKVSRPSRSIRLSYLTGHQKLSFLEGQGVLKKYDQFRACRQEFRRRDGSLVIA
jgi:hypothetical protein